MEIYLSCGQQSFEPTEKWNRDSTTYHSALENREKGGKAG